MAEANSTPERASAKTIKVKLTTKYIENLQAPAKGERLTVWDLDEPGLAVRVFDSGHKSFIVTKRIRGGDPKRITIRPAFPLCTLAMARAKAQELKIELSNGVDPIARRRAEDAAREQRKAEEKDTSFIVVAEAYIAKKMVGANPAKPLLRSAAMLADAIRRDLCSQPWAKKPVASITKADIVGTIAATVKDKKRTRQGEWSQVAFRSFNMTRQVLKWALTKDEFRLQVNVCDRIDVKEEIGADRPPARERILDDRELRLFWSATGRMGFPGGSMLRLLLLSACRLREIAHLGHDEVTAVESAAFTGPVIVIPPERMKGRNGKVPAHTVPLTSAMTDLMEALPKFTTPGRYVFSYTGGRCPMSSFDALKEKVDHAILAIVREELGLAADAEVPEEHLLPRWTFHDLRRTARSLMSRVGVDPDTAERVLAHKLPGMRGIYDRHAYDAQKHAALCKLSDEIARITGGNVVALPVRKKRTAG